LKHISAFFNTRVLCCGQVTKSEKEIMRPLYNRYRALKKMIATPSSVSAHVICSTSTVLSLRSHTAGRDAVC